MKYTKKPKLTWAYVESRIAWERAEAERIAVEAERKKFAEEQKRIRLDALKALSQFLSVAGQAAQQLTDAMKSEAGQL